MRINRFTFKDPAKEFKFQQRKKAWLPKAFTYGQQTLIRSGDVALVEGENDLISLLDAGYPGPVLATIGSVSRTQVEYVLSLDRPVVTFFDNDDAGDGYRAKFPQATHYTVPERGSDIDEFIHRRGDWQSLEPVVPFIPLAEVISPLEAGACGSETGNDVGNANYMCRLLGRNLCYVRESGDFWHFIDEKWQPAGVQIMKYAEATAVDMLSEGYRMKREAENDDDAGKADSRLESAYKLHSLPKLKAMVELVKPKVEVSTSQFDANPMLLGVQNGVIELGTGLYRENRRGDLITSYSPVNYSPLAVCPTWEKFIGDIFLADAEMIAFIQRCVGYWLTGRVDEQLMFFFYGHGSNGKSTFIQAIQNLFGAYATQINSDALMVNRNMGGPNASLAKLPGKRLVVVNELPENGRFDETLIKSMTGGDVLVARQVYGKHEIEFTAQFSLVIIGNHKPVIHDMSHGMWRRMCLIPFMAQFSAEQADPDLPVKLNRELPGILNWALRGVLEWQDKGIKRSLPATIQMANEEYREESDLLGEFLAECRREPDVYTPASEIYRAFREFASDGNEWKMTQRVLNKKLVERGFRKFRRNNLACFAGIAVVDRELGPVTEPVRYVV